MRTRPPHLSSSTSASSEPVVTDIQRDGQTLAGPDAVVWRGGAPLSVGWARTLPELFARCLAEFPDQVVLIDRERRCTWRQLDAWSGALAAHLAERLRPGERLAILAHNGLPHLLAELAAWRLGAVAAPLFTGFAASRLRELLANVVPAVILAENESLAELVGSEAMVLSPAGLLALAMRPGRCVEPSVTADTPCLIQFTSGSTGMPRGVVLTHGNLCSQQAAFAQLWPEIGVGDRLASYLPWHHSFGALAERLWSLSRGATLTVVPGGGRDRNALVATMRAVRPTVFMSVPKVHALVAAEGLFDRGGLRWAFTAGAPLSAELFAWYENRGIPVYEGWGLTETSPSCTITPAGSSRAAGVVGQPIPGVEVGVRAGDGRIFVRGPNVMAGYFRQEATCLRDGVLDSGDLGMWTATGLRLTGRADHQLKLANGEKVSAAEIEAQLHAQCEIAHAVVGVDGDLFAVIEATAGTAVAEVVAAVRCVNELQQVPYHRIVEVLLAREPMTIENGQLTASLKVSRGCVLQALRCWRTHGGDAFASVPL